MKIRVRRSRKWLVVWLSVLGLSSFGLFKVDNIIQAIADYAGVSPAERAWPIQVFPKWPTDPSIYKSQNIMVYDLTDQRVLLNKNGDQPVPVASLVKIMTAILAIEKLDNYDTKTVTITAETMAEMQAQNASVAGFRAGEVIVYLDLLYGAMLPSGGEATLSLAQAVAGSEAEFVELMNQKAKGLHLKTAVFKNSTGLDAEGQVASPRDIIKLLRYALKNPDFRRILTAAQHQLPNGRILKSSVLSQIKSDEQEGFEVLGGKSGTTYAAGLCWATLATKNDHELLVITLRAPLDNLNKPTPYQKMDTLAILKDAPISDIK